MDPRATAAPPYTYTSVPNQWSPRDAANRVMDPRLHVAPGGRTKRVSRPQRPANGVMDNPNCFAQNSSYIPAVSSADSESFLPPISRRQLLATRSHLLTRISEMERATQVLVKQLGHIDGLLSATSALEDPLASEPGRVPFAIPEANTQHRQYVSFEPQQSVPYIKIEDDSDYAVPQLQCEDNPSPPPPQLSTPVRPVPTVAVDSSPVRQLQEHGSTHTTTAPAQPLVPHDEGLVAPAVAPAVVPPAVPPAVPLAEPAQAMPLAGPAQAVPLAGPAQAMPLAEPAQAIPLAGPAQAVPQEVVSAQPTQQTQPSTAACVATSSQPLVLQDIPAQVTHAAVVLAVDPQVASSNNNLNIPVVPHPHASSINRLSATSSQLVSAAPLVTAPAAEPVVAPPPPPVGIEHASLPIAAAPTTSPAGAKQNLDRSTQAAATATHTAVGTKSCNLTQAAVESRTGNEADADECPGTEYDSCATDTGANSPLGVGAMRTQQRRIPPPRAAVMPASARASRLVNDARTRAKGHVFTASAAVPIRHHKPGESSPPQDKPQPVEPRPAVGNAGNGQGQPKPAAEGNVMFAVETILQTRTRRGKREYLVKWLDFSERDNTWEPERNLRQCPELVQAFHEAHGIGKRPAKRRRTNSRGIGMRRRRAMRS